MEPNKLYTVLHSYIIFQDLIPR